MDRRNFIQAAALGAAAGGAPSLATVALKNAKGASRRQPSDRFPASFWWGAATASYQVEGAAAEEGRGPSIWDTFSHTPGRTFHGETGDVACDHYHRFKEDVAWMAELGVKHYRFSLSWSRILPAGRGAVNEPGVDFYQRLVDELLAKGITPHATLYHWDLPQALQDRYRGWQGREVVEDFGEFASLVVGRLGDRVSHWMTLNEIASFALLGHGVKAPGPHAPGLALERPRDAWQVVHHALLAHGRACQAIRAASPRPCSVAIADNPIAMVPVIETPEHIEAARRAVRSWSRNGCILTPLLTGAYDPAWLAEQGAEAPLIQAGDMELIHQKLDAFGFNNYTGRYVRAAGNPQGYEVLSHFEGYPKLGFPWLNHLPEAIYWGIRHLGEAFGQGRLPVFISENGCADSGPTEGPGEVQDVDRVMYLRSYLRQVLRAHQEGYPVLGYFPWSLMDNYEWAEGYSKRCGLLHVDYPTQRRSPKLSYRWYQEVIRSGRVV